MKLLALLLVAAGCYMPPGDLQRHHDGQDEAVALAMDTYGSSARPRVAWAEGDDLDCTVPSNGRRGFSTPDGCLEGWTWNPLYVSVAWRPGDSMCDTALAHELAHNALMRRWVIDRHHQRAAWWGPGGLVDKALARAEERAL